MDARHFLEAKTAKEQVSAKVSAAGTKPNKNACSLATWHAGSANYELYFGNY